MQLQDIEKLFGRRLTTLGHLVHKTSNQHVGMFPDLYTSWIDSESDIQRILRIYDQEVV